MAFDKIKNFIAPVDEDDDDEEELEYRESEVKPISSYERKQTTVRNIPTNASMSLFEPRAF